jgi:sugar lactone lactonase YvrE
MPAGPITVADGIPARAVAADPAVTVRSGPIPSGPTRILYSRNDIPNRVVEPGRNVLSWANSWVSYGKSTLPRIGTGQAGSLGDGGPSLSAELDLATESLFKRSGLAIASDGKIYVADTKNSTIRSVEGQTATNSGIIRSVAGKWAARQNVSLVEPMGIAVDRAGNLYIADHGAGAVDVLLASTGQLETLAQVVSPASIAVALDGSKVFVASPETGGVFAINTSTRSIAIVPGFAPAAAASSSSSDSKASPCAALDAAAGSETISADVIAAASAQKTVCAAGLAVDGQANLFVADANAGNILRVDARTNKMTLAVTGLSVPGDIAFDAKGDLFVSEQGRSRIIALGTLGAPPSNLTLTAPPPPAGCAQGIVFTYCAVPTAGSSAPFAFTLTNTSTTTVATGLIIAPLPKNTVPPPPAGDFTVTSTSCTATLAANSSCVINVAFTPLTTGLRLGAIGATDAQGDVATIGVAGTGDDFSVQMVPGLPSEVTVAQGGTATFMAQLNADAVFGLKGEMVTLACPINLPRFTDCAFTPCPLAPTVGGNVPFSIVIITSSQTKQAPEIQNPCNTPPAGNVERGARLANGIMRITTNTPRSGPRFPALLAVFALAALACLTAGAFGSGVLPRRYAPALRVHILFAVAVFAAALFTACGSGTTTFKTVTPIAVTTMNITASATDSSGNPLNASRGMQITLDVIKGF